MKEAKSILNYIYNDHDKNSNMDHNNITHSNSTHNSSTLSDDSTVLKNGDFSNKNEFIEKNGTCILDKNSNMDHNDHSIDQTQHSSNSILHMNCPPIFDSNWTLDESIILLELYYQFDGRFHVIYDRWSNYSSKQVKMEDLMNRVYQMIKNIIRVKLREDEMLKMRKDKRGDDLKLREDELFNGRKKIKKEEYEDDGTILMKDDGTTVLKKDDIMEESNITSDHNDIDTPHHNNDIDTPHHNNDIDTPHHNNDISLSTIHTSPHLFDPSLHASSWIDFEYDIKKDIDRKNQYEVLLSDPSNDDRIQEESSLLVEFGRIHSSFQRHTRESQKMLKVIQKQQNSWLTDQLKKKMKQRESLDNPKKRKVKSIKKKESIASIKLGLPSTNLIVSSQTQKYQNQVQNAFLELGIDQRPRTNPIVSLYIQELKADMILLFEIQKMVSEKNYQIEVLKKYMNKMGIKTKEEENKMSHKEGKKMKKSIGNEGKKGKSGNGKKNNEKEGKNIKEEGKNIKEEGKKGKSGNGKKINEKEGKKMKNVPKEENKMKKRNVTKKTSRKMKKGEESIENEQSELENKEEKMVQIEENHEKEFIESMEMENIDDDEEKGEEIKC